MSNNLLNNALNYASMAGWYVFPCKKDKSPYTKHGCKDASVDPDQIKKWWKKWPGASIGCACGPGSKIWILDIDLPSGPDSLEKLILENEDLPITRVQKTGSGGMQYFFSWNGLNIKNTSNKIGNKIDTRGAGGYVILPPSPHPSGGTYEWIKKIHPIPFSPKWLSDLIVKREPINHISHPMQGGNSPYGLMALSQEIILLSGSGEGQRNDQLNKSGYALGQLVSGGELEAGHVENSLLGVAFSIGLEETEARKTFKSSFDSGMQTPRKAAEKETNNYYNLKNSQQSQQSQQSNQFSAVLSSSQQEGGISQQFSAENDQKQPEPPMNLAGHIKKYIENSSGSFTTRDIDTEFGLKTRQEKNARSSALLYMARKSLIIKDKGLVGKYHIIDSKIDWIDLDAAPEEKFNIILPFNLHEYVLIPPKAIIVLAGSTNAGKTSFILNTLKLNLCQKYIKTYLMSEMGPGEYVSRLKSFNEPMAKWKSIQAASKSYDFNGAIEHHNKDGLTCIDYLEEVEGEYFKIASNIRSIYDALGNGVAIVAIQKKANQDFARGGEGTMEKSRLYLTLDYLCTREHSIVCALKITKLKNFIGKNLQNHELHFEITRGSQMEALTDWAPSHKINRDKCKIEYERTNQEVDIVAKEYVVTFKTASGRIVGINGHDHYNILKNYGMEAESLLEKLSIDSYKSDFVKDKNWYMQITGILAKKLKNL